MIYITVEGQRLSLRQSVVVSDTIDYLEVSVDFKTADWDGLSKWIHFTNGSDTYKINLSNNHVLKQDHLNLAEGSWDVYIHGTSTSGSRITTSVGTLRVKQTGPLNGEPLPNIPLTPAEQIDNKAQMALNVANDVKRRADNGEFKGEKGDKGDAYVHSEEFENLSQQVRTDAQESKKNADAAKNSALNAKASENASAESATTADTSAKQASSDALAASKSADTAKVFADKAEQSAATKGYMEFHINEAGNLIFSRTDNVTDVDFQLENGELILYG